MRPYYQDDAVTLYHGDCREILPHVSGDVLVTDPPYGIGFDYGVDGHDDHPERYDEVMARLAEAEGRVVSWCVVFQSAAAWRSWADRFPRAERLLAMPKTFVQLNRGHPAHATDYALVWNLGDKQKREPWHPIPFRDWFVCDTSDMTNRVGHPCPRPQEAMRWIVSGFCPPRGVILDPFAGSGTTLRAAKDLGRRAIGIEIEEKYCEVAALRCAQEVINLGGTDKPYRATGNGGEQCEFPVTLG